MNSDYLKHVAVAIAAIVAILSAFQAVILVFGGSFPPWATAAEFRELRRNVDGIIADRDDARCEDWNRRLDNARMRLMLEKGNTVDEDTILVARREIRRIPNCMER